MVIEKMKIRNSANTVTGLVMSLLIVISIFSGLTIYFSDQITESGQVLDDKYVDAQTNVTKIGSSVDTNIQKIVDKWATIEQGKFNAFAVWNGFTGLGLVLMLPFSFLMDATNLFEAVFAPLSVLPGWVLPLALTALTAYLILLFLKVLKGEPNL